jgi:Domain of unknown function (DUF3784)
MIPVSIGFVSAGLLLLTMGFLIRKGVTWLIAGYDPSQVRDEKGLAKWAGSCFMAMGAIGILAGGLVYLLPPDYTFIPVIVFAVAIPAGAITSVIGLQRFVK